MAYSVTESAALGTTCSVCRGSSRQRPGRKVTQPASEWVSAVLALVEPARNAFREASALDDTSEYGHIALARMCVDVIESGTKSRASGRRRPRAVARLGRIEAAENVGYPARSDQSLWWPSRSAADRARNARAGRPMKPRRSGRPGPFWTRPWSATGRQLAMPSSQPEIDAGGIQALLAAMA
jgi:hypothetical protein